MLLITRVDPRVAQIVDLIKKSQTHLNDLFVQEDNHYLSLDELCDPKILFYGAKINTKFVGCGGILITKNYGELKSIFIDPKHRRIGVAKSLISKIEEDAIKMNIRTIKLETGNLLKPALNLYHQLGYRQRGPFGNYKAAKASIFMEKSFSIQLDK